MSGECSSTSLEGSSFKKERKVLKSQTRETIVSVKNYFDKEKSNSGPLISVTRVLDRTTAALQIFPKEQLSGSSRRKG